MALSPSRSNVLTAGIKDWAIKNASKPDTGYGDLQFLRTGNIAISTVGPKNQFQQPLGTAFPFKASAQFLATRTEANFISLLGDMCTDLIDHRITLVNGQVISSAPTTSTPSPTGFGVNWKLVSDKDLDDAMYVEITADRNLLSSEYTQILTSANADNTAAVSGDTFDNFGSLTRADVVPAGIAQFALGAAGAGTYADVVQNLRNGKFTAETVSIKDQYQRSIATAIKITLDVEALETVQAELLKWNGIATRNNECKITFANGMVCTLPNVLGSSYGVNPLITYTSNKDMDDAAFIHVQGEGLLPVSAWAGIWS